MYACRLQLGAWLLQLENQVRLLLPNLPGIRYPLLPICHCRPLVAEGHPGAV